MSAEVDFTFDAKKGDAWNGENHPQIQITLGSEGKLGIWVCDGSDGLVACWCDVSVNEIRALLGVCNYLAEPNESLEGAQ